MVTAMGWVGVVDHSLSLAMRYHSWAVTTEKASVEQKLSASLGGHEVRDRFRPGVLAPLSGGVGLVAAWPGSRGRQRGVVHRDHPNNRWRQHMRRWPCDGVGEGPQLQHRALHRLEREAR